MSRHSLLLVFTLAAIATLPAKAQRIAPPDLAADRTALLEAFRDAERGALSVQDVARIADHPLRGWVEATALRERITTAGAAEVRAALKRHDGTPAADWLRDGWLVELARREDWPAFRADFRGAEGQVLRCADLAARHATGATDARWIADGKALWLTGTTLPSTCDVPFRALQALGHIDDALRWQRIELAAKEGQTGLMRFLAAGLPTADAARR